MFGWFKARRRQRLLAEPMPAHWQRFFERVAYFHCLTPAEQRLLTDASRILVAEKNWEGCKGLDLTDEMKVTIAAMACVLILHHEGFYFDNVMSILVYPAGFRIKSQEASSGFVIEGQTPLVGEAVYRGPVILAWDEVEYNARVPGSGHNLVFHEFAHQLDMLSGSADGVPPLPRELQQRWQRIMNREFDHLKRAAEHGRRTLIDPYGATNSAEFFAVISECFFDRGSDLRVEHPELYQILGEYYRQDPARWPW